VPQHFAWLGFHRVQQTDIDLILNILAYLPLGGLLSVLLYRLGWKRPVLSTCVIASLLSFNLECMQFFLPGRVTALHDWLSNSAGALVGAVLAFSATGERIQRALASLRLASLSPAAHAELGVVLLLVWLVAQSNPGIPFFEAGQLVNVLLGTAPPVAGPQRLVDLLPQVIAVSLNVCGFALFVSIWTHPRIFAGVPVLVALIAGLMVKFFAAGLLLKAPLLEGWLGPASILGLIAGYFLALLLLATRWRTRLLLALLLTFGGGLMARMSGIYDGFDSMLRLFAFPHPQLGTFASITRWLSELWPVLAFIYLAVLWVRGSPEDEQK
jgi:VanZ like family